VLELESRDVGAALDFVGGVPVAGDTVGLVVADLDKRVRLVGGFEGARKEGEEVRKYFYFKKSSGAL
jgi:hypothetical protein